jgi:hypothetical protein
MRLGAIEVTVAAGGISGCVVVTGDTAIGLDGGSNGVVAGSVLGCVIGLDRGLNGVVAREGDPMGRYRESANVKSEDWLEWSERRWVWLECRPSRKELEVKGT